MLAFNLKPGTIFKGRYEIIAELGEGGFAKVLRAKDLDLSREVAIKLLKFDPIQLDAELPRFYREAKLLAQMKHQNIVSVYSVELLEDGRTPVIIMEYLHGKSLQDFIVGQHGSLEPASLATIFTQVCEGLSYAHKSGIIHRDLSPSNIFLLEGAIDKVKIIDFGLSKAVKKESPDGTATITQTGALLGNPAYMSPEQWRGENLDGRSDIYSLGAIMYESMSGQAAFEAWSPMDMLNKSSKYPVAPSCKWQDKLQERNWQRIILKCLQKDISKRFQSVDELKKFIESGKDADTILSSSLDPWSGQKTKDRKRGPIFTLALLAVSVLICIGLWRFTPLLLKTFHSEHLVGLEERFANSIFDHEPLAAAMLYDDLLSYRSVRADPAQQHQISLKLARYYKTNGKLQPCLEILQNSLAYRGTVQVQALFLKDAGTILSTMPAASLPENREIRLRCKILQQSLELGPRYARLSRSLLDSLLRRGSLLLQLWSKSSQKQDEKVLAELLDQICKAAKILKFEADKDEDDEIKSICELTKTMFPQLMENVLDLADQQLKHSINSGIISQTKLTIFDCLSVRDKAKAIREGKKFLAQNEGLDPSDRFELIMRTAKLASILGMRKETLDLLGEAESFFREEYCQSFRDDREGPKFWDGVRFYNLELDVYGKLGENERKTEALRKLRSLIPDLSTLGSSVSQISLGNSFRPETLIWASEQRVHAAFRSGAEGCLKNKDLIGAKLFLKRHLEMLETYNQELPLGFVPGFRDLQASPQNDKELSHLISQIISSAENARDNK